MKRLCISSLVTAVFLLCGFSLFAVGAKEGTSGAAATQPNKQITIAITYQDLANEYIAKLQKGVQAEAQKLGVKLIEADGQGDPAKQVAQAENFVTQKVDAIILNPYDKSGSAPVVTIGNKAGIPVIDVCSFVENLDQARVFVGSDDPFSGELEMQQMAKVLGGKGNIVIIEGPIGHSGQIARDTGYKNILTKYPDIKILARQTAEWDRAKALTLTENWLTAGLPIDGIVAQNDEMAMGALKAAIAAGKNLPIMGIDAIPDALKAVKDGSLAATVFQDALGQGSGAVEASYNVVMKKDVPKRIIIPYVLVTKANVDQFFGK